MLIKKSTGCEDVQIVDGLDCKALTQVQCEEAIRLS